MSYHNDHTADACDKCLKPIGSAHLRAVPFMYLDYNDKIHPITAPPAYHQYYVCDDCWKTVSNGAL